MDDARGTIRLAAEWAGLLAGFLLIGSTAFAESRYDLGRLFTDPQQRAEIDRLRHRGDTDDAGATPAPVAVGPSVRPIRVNGVVRRSDGRTIVWVNGRSVDDGGVTPEGIRVRVDPSTPRRVALVVPGRPEQVVLEPGEQFNLVRRTSAGENDGGEARD